MSALRARVDGACRGLSHGTCRAVADFVGCERVDVLRVRRGLAKGDWFAAVIYLAARAQMADMMDGSGLQTDLEDFVGRPS